MDGRPNRRNEAPVSTTSFPGSSLYLEKVPWLRLVTCLCMPTQTAQRVGPPLNLFREVNVVLLYRRYFEKKETSYFSEILSNQRLVSALTSMIMRC